MLSDFCCELISTFKGDNLSFFVCLVAFIWGQSLGAILGVLVIVIVDTIFALINMVLINYKIKLNPATLPQNDPSVASL